jgi:hypothetical protein
MSRGIDAFVLKNMRVVGVLADDGWKGANGEDGFLLVDHQEVGTSQHEKKCPLADYQWCSRELEADDVARTRPGAVHSAFHITHRHSRAVSPRRWPSAISQWQWRGCLCG